jgi:hypothetical protein
MTRTNNSRKGIKEGMKSRISKCQDRKCPICDHPYTKRLRPIYDILKFYNLLENIKCW